MMAKRSITAPLFILALALFSFGARASNSNLGKETERFESVAMPNTQIRKIYSKFTKQSYRIYVNIPATYHNEPQRKYPALFTLDADYSFPLAKQTSEHLSDRNHIPEVFVFSIAYDGPLNYRLTRTRDYTPTYCMDNPGYGPEFQKHSGGGPAFADFLEKELIPYLEKSFRISNQRALVGHSYGGLFAAWMLIARPQVFNGYISLSPSLWYDNMFVSRLEKQIASTRKDLKAKAFFGVGEKEARVYGTSFAMVDDMQKLVATLIGRKYKNLQIRSAVFPDENHDTVYPGALTRGIMFVFGKES